MRGGSSLLNASAIERFWHCSGGLLNLMDVGRRSRRVNANRRFSVVKFVTNVGSSCAL